MRIALENFNGLAPLIEPRRLADDMATIASNCVFEEKTIRPLRAPLAAGVTLAGTTVSVVPVSGTLVEFNEDVDFARSPVRNDAYQRIYVTDSAYPKVRSGAAEYRLGIPRPTAAPGATATDIPDPANDEELLEAETLYYTFCYVDSYGAEGPNSPVSGVVERVRNTDVNLTFPAVPSGDYNFGAGAKIRIYRSNTGSSETEFQFVADVAIGTAAWTDTVLNEALGEVIPSAEWIGPPDDSPDWPDGPLQGITAMPNGVLAGFTGRTLHFSEPYVPHAWPLKYRITVPADIVGLAMTAAGLFVATEGKPVLIVGAEPASFSDIPMDGDASLPCVSKRSLVDMGDYCIYASDEGLALAEGTRVTNITQNLISKTDWQAYNPDSMIAGSHNGRYVAFYDTGVVQAGLIFDPLGERNALVETNIYSELVYTLPRSSTLYIRQGTDLCQWDAGVNLTYTWQSKTFVIPPTTNFAYFELLGDITATQVTLTFGGNTYQFNATERYTVLPGYSPESEWAVKFVGTDTIIYAGLYESLEEAA